MRSRFSRPRGGFTIIELLVAAAVSILLMVIITEAFKRGIDMFRSMRAQGVMMERLRTAATTLRDDLAAHHLPENNGQLPYVGEFTNLESPPWVPPQDGFFRVYQGPMGFDAAGVRIPFLVEGTDRDNMLFTRATTHILQMSVMRKGTSPDNMFRTAEIGLLGGPPASQYIDPPAYGETGVFSSRWAEVSYFLYPNGDTANGTQLYNLYRRQQLLIPSSNVAPAMAKAMPTTDMIPATTANPEISTRYTAAGNFYNDTHFVTQPRYRFGMQPLVTLATDPRAAGFPIVMPVPNNPAPTPFDLHAYPPIGSATLQAGDDIILADVISFEIKAMYAPITTVTPIDDPPQATYSLPGIGTVVNSDYPFDYLPQTKRNTAFFNNGIRVFDTWSSNDIYATWDQAPSPVAIPLRIKLKAVLIRVRIWDAKSEQTRQVTIIQDI